MPGDEEWSSNASRAHAEIHARISTGTLRPGQFLSEAEIGRELRMSRTPVREAINRLVHEGLLVVLPNRGTMVASLEVSDISEIYVLREVLEALACRLAARGPDVHLTERLVVLLDAMRAAAKDANLVEFTRLDIAFHRQIAEAGGNGRLVKLLEPLWTSHVLQPYRERSFLSGDRFARSVAEHAAMLAALRERDPRKAERLVRHHARSSFRDFVANALHPPYRGTSLHGRAN